MLPLGNAQGVCVAALGQPKSLRSFGFSMPSINLPIFQRLNIFRSFNVGFVWIVRDASARR